jgi:hypothetical protein
VTVSDEIFSGKMPLSGILLKIPRDARSPDPGRHRLSPMTRVFPDSPTRRGRPRRFAVRSRAVTPTLPLDAIHALSPVVADHRAATARGTRRGRKRRTLP